MFKIPEIFKPILEEDHYVGDAIEESLKKDQYTSVTGLLKGTKEFHLRRRHSQAIEANTTLADGLWSTIGSLLHERLEKFYSTEEMRHKGFHTELRMYHTFDVDGQESEISGKFDLANTKTLSMYDLKVTASYTLDKIAADDHEYYIMQQNIYRYLFYKSFGIELKNLYIIGFDKYWRKGEELRKLNYGKEPNQPVRLIKVRTIPFEEVKEYIIKQIRDKRKYDEVEDDLIPECTIEDRWGTEDSIALYLEDFLTKSGTINKKKRATRLLPVSLEEIKEYLDYKNKVSGKIGIEFRAGVSTKKCKDFCDCNAKCNFYQSEKKKRQPPKLNDIVDLSIEGDLEEKFATLKKKIDKY